MNLIVQKFGGTSVASVEHINKVADKIIKFKDYGYDIVVVVSAMALETDKLDSYAAKVSNHGSFREYDVLLAAGEQVTIALLSMALIAKGYQARSYLGSQVPIVTDSIHKRAKILHISPDNLLSDLGNGVIPVVAGFQGVDQFGNITTLGRGGSDITAVALASALTAKECHVYTDVSGVYTTDPKVVGNASKLTCLTYKEMLELSSLGAKVLQDRAVRLAKEKKVVLRVLSTFTDDEKGTLVADEGRLSERMTVTTIAFSKKEARIIIQGISDSKGVASQVLEPIGAANIPIDMIIHNVREDGKQTFTFTVQRSDLSETMIILKKLQKELVQDIYVNQEIAKLSLVGVGMSFHASMASKMFRILEQAGVSILATSSSEIKVSVLIDEKDLELGVQALHDAFELGTNYKTCTSTKTHGMPQTLSVVDT